MYTFPVRKGSHTHRVALVTLHPVTRDSDTAVYCVDCGVYKPGPGNQHSVSWTGLSIKGRVPVAEFIRWALRKGYLKWKRSTL